MFIPVPLPFLVERAIAVSVPQKGRFFVLGHDALVTVTINTGINTGSGVEIGVVRDESKADDESILDTTTRTMTIGSQRHRALCLHGASSILEAGGMRLQFKHASETNRQSVMLTDVSGKYLQEFTVIDSSGDWGHVSFDDVGSLIICAFPNDLYLYRRKA